MKKKTIESREIQSLNENILRIDLDDLEVETMEQRIEMTLAGFFDLDTLGVGDPDQQCPSFTCNPYTGMS